MAGIYLLLYVDEYIHLFYFFFILTFLDRLSACPLESLKSGKLTSQIKHTWRESEEGDRVEGYIDLGEMLKDQHNRRVWCS